MPLQTQADVSTRHQFRLLLLSKPGHRKSSIAAHFPAPGFLDGDQNIYRLREHYPDKKFKFAQPQYDANGKVLAKADIWPRVITLVDELIADPEVKTIVLDSISALQEPLIDWILAQPAGTNKMKPLVISGVQVLTREQYRPFADKLLDIVAKIHTSGKPTIWIFHEREQRTEQGILELVEPHVTSSLRGNISRVFTDVWRTKLKIVPEDKAHPTGAAYFIRTAPEREVPYLCTSGTLPNEFEFVFDKPKAAALGPDLSKAFPWLTTL